MAGQMTTTQVLQLGDRVRVGTSYRCPYAGQVGTVVTIDFDDKHGPILVSLEDGLRFRYTLSELQLCLPKSTSDPRAALNYLQSFGAKHNSTEPKQTCAEHDEDARFGNGRTEA